MNLRISASFLAAALWAGSVFAQGTLTPPGVPAPTMRTLTQVEPRTPITNLPYTITQPGAYYLAGNLASTDDGVVIMTNGVTLDLMGFTIDGNRISNGAGVEIYSSGPPIQNITVRNGRLRGLGYGLWAPNCQGCRFENLDASDNLWHGFMLGNQGGVFDGNTLSHCSATGNTLAGMEMDGSSDQCDGNRIVHCVISDNKQEGLHFWAGNGQCNGNIISDCVIQGNDEEGLSFESGTGRCNGNVISRCRILDNASYGLYLNGSSGRCNGNLISGCTVSSNAVCGILLRTLAGEDAGNVIAGCAVGENAGTGIYLNMADDNRVENNRVYDFGGGMRYGIDCRFTTNNLIVRNSCGGQTVDFTMSAASVYGPVVTNEGALATSGAGAHPWANFSQ